MSAQPIFIVYDGWFGPPRTLKVFASRKHAKRFIAKQTWPRNWRLHARKVSR